VKVELIGIAGLPEITAGAPLAALIAAAAEAMDEGLRSSDVLVVTQKIVSKAEGRTVTLAGIVPSAFASRWAESHHLDARLVELVLRESRRIVRMDRGVLIAETHHGLVCANAGVDISNVDGGETALLLPEDPDSSAERIRSELAGNGADVAVVVSDTFGRPWRDGLINVAVGAAGLAPLRSYVGARDPFGLPLQATVEAVADELAAAAGLVSSKLSRTPAVIVRGFVFERGRGGARDLLRPPERDLFR
jgi:coenzyme F420-0:L-glutamate ligase / coenzyme F420-1:gamma-L-glutamate ligase